MAHRHTIKYNPLFICLWFICFWYEIKKQHLFLKLVTIYWTSASSCFRFALTFSLTYRIKYLKKYSCNKRMKNIFTYMYLPVSWFFHVAVAILIEIHAHLFSWHMKVLSHSTTSCPGPTLNQHSKLCLHWNIRWTILWQYLIGNLKLCI